MLFKKNIWTIFYLITVCGFVLLFSMSWLKWSDLKMSFQTEQIYYTDIISRAFHSQLLQYDLLLDILGSRLIENDNYKNPQNSTLLFDRLLNKNHALAGFGLADINGKLVAVSSNLKHVDLSLVPNLKQYASTRVSFNQALNSNNLVLGRSYYMPALKQWLIPMRHAIRDNKGKVLAVMTTGIKIEDNRFFNNLNLPANMNYVLIKEETPGVFYRLYQSGLQKSELEKVLSQPIKSELYNSAIDYILEHYHLTRDELRTGNITYNLEGIDYQGTEIIAGLRYDNRYQVWTLVKTDISQMYNTFINVFFIYIGIYLLFLGVLYYLCRHIDLSEQKNRDILKFNAHHDSLTRLPNRNYLYNHINEWINSSEQPFYLLYLDLDNFKNINDHYGHQIGDKVLTETARRFQSFFNKNFNSNSLVIRQGGDEFIILMKTRNRTQDETTIEQLISTISSPYFIDSYQFYIGVSIGIARYPYDSRTLEALLSQSDIAMYEAKKEKNTWQFYTAEMKDHTRLTSDIELQLRSAIKNGELFLVYQPQLTKDGRLYGVEALARWNNKTLGMVPPDQFIAVAEATGQMPDIGEFIFNCALREIQALHEKLQQKFRLSINVSVKQFSVKNCLEKLLFMVNFHGFDINYLTMELTESLFIEDLDYVLPILKSAKEQGIELSLDDFGTGYSSLSMLEKLPIDELKIDKSFVDEMLHNQRYQAMVQSIVSIGKNLSQHTLAEGVETAEQVEMLERFDCEIYQGYYFSRPLSLTDLEIFIRENSL